MVNPHRLGAIRIAELDRWHDLEIAVLDIPLYGIQSASAEPPLPRRLLRIEYVVHLFQRLAFRLWRCEEHMNEGQNVQRAEDHVHLPVDAPYQRRYRETNRAIPHPIRSCTEGDGFGANTGRENLGGVNPRCWAPGHGKDTDEEVREGNDGSGNVRMALDDPRDRGEVRIFVVVGSAIEGF